jgi:hypothetical protein
MIDRLLSRVMTHYLAQIKLTVIVFIIVILLLLLTQAHHGHIFQVMTDLISIKADRQYLLCILYITTAIMTKYLSIFPAELEETSSPPRC